MRIDWGNDRNAPPARVVDLDTGEHIALCMMADEETGEYVQYAYDGEKWHLADDGRVRLIPGRARIEIQPLGPGEDYFVPGRPVRYSVKPRIKLDLSRS